LHTSPPGPDCTNFSRVLSHGGSFESAESFVRERQKASEQTCSTERIKARERRGRYGPRKSVHLVEEAKSEAVAAIDVLTRARSSMTVSDSFSIDYLEILQNERESPALSRYERRREVILEGEKADCPSHGTREGEI